MSPRLRGATQSLVLRSLNRFDALRLARRMRQHAGLEIDPRASRNLAAARFVMGAGARLHIGAGVVSEREPRALRFLLEPGAQVEVGEGTWLRTDLGPVVIAAFEGANLRMGPECFLNGCHLSAKQELVLGRRVWVGPGSRIFDSDQHDFDADHPERSEPVQIGDHVWIGSDVTVLRGVRIGEHSVIGARSVVTRDVPPHTLAFGIPAEPRGKVGDRSSTR